MDDLISYNFIHKYKIVAYVDKILCYILINEITEFLDIIFRAYKTNNPENNVEFKPVIIGTKVAEDIFD